MPYYEYRCEACGHELEAKQRITEDALVTCPSCEADGLKRLISATSFVLKGGGWYVTDYGSKKGAGDSDGSSKPKTDSSSSDSSSSDSSKADSSSSPSGDSKGSSSASTSSPAKPSGGTASTSSSD